MDYLYQFMFTICKNDDRYKFKLFELFWFQVSGVRFQEIFNLRSSIFNVLVFFSQRQIGPVQSDEGYAKKIDDIPGINDAL